VIITDLLALDIIWGPSHRPWHGYLHLNWEPTAFCLREDCALPFRASDKVDRRSFGEVVFQPAKRADRPIQIPCFSYILPDLPINIPLSWIYPQRAIRLFTYLCRNMNQVSISQLWGKAWDLLKSNGIVMVGLYILTILLNLLVASLSFIKLPLVQLIAQLMNGSLTSLILTPALIRAGYLAARQGQVSFTEPFTDILMLLRVFVYFLLLNLIPVMLIVMGVVMSFLSIYELIEDMESYSGTYSTGSDFLKLLSLIFRRPESILIVFGIISSYIFSFFGWAGPYAILSGRAGIVEAISYSFSLTARNFGRVLLAFLSYIGLWILGLIPCCLGLLVVVPMYYLFMPLLYMALEGGRPSYA